MNKSEKSKSKVAACLIASLFITLFPIIPNAPLQECEPLVKTAHAASLSNPRIVPDDTMKAEQKVTWDCIWFGSYPQAEVVTKAMKNKYTAIGSECLQKGDLIVDNEAYTALKTATDWDANGDIILNGKKYRRMKRADAISGLKGYSDYYNWTDSKTYHYFLYQPIKWWVLSTDGDKALLLSDKVLDCQMYDCQIYTTRFIPATWAVSTIRSWLNGYDSSANDRNIDYRNKNFLNSAFNVAERYAIQNTLIANDKNLEYGTRGGKDTTDKLFFLSESEVYTDDAESYGFVIDGSIRDEARNAKSSTYAKAMGLRWSTRWNSDRLYEGNCEWWLRSPGYFGTDAACVYGNGYVVNDGELIDEGNGVRVALNLNLHALSDAYNSLPKSSFDFALNLSLHALSDAVSLKLYSYAGTVCSDGMVVEAGNPPNKIKKVK